MWKRDDTPESWHYGSAIWVEARRLQIGRTMNKTGIAVVVAVALALAPRPAQAACGRDCMPWPFDLLGAAVVLGLAGGYVAGTGYFVYRDATDDQQSLKYGGIELGVNAGLSAMWTAGAFAADGPGERTIYAGLALVHAGLAVHGGYRTVLQRDELNIPRETGIAAAGLGYAANTLIWTLNLGGDHDRAYGLWEAGVNAPLALGLGYVAIDRARDGDTGHAALFGGMALVSGALATHGIVTAISPPQSPGLDLLGAALAPTMVSDGRSLAPGLAARGTW